MRCAVAEESNKLERSTAKQLVGYKDHALTEYLGPSGVVTLKMYERLASHEGRPKGAAGVVALMSDTLNDYLKKNYPHFELEYQEDAKGIHPELLTETEGGRLGTSSKKQLKKPKGKKG